LYTIFLPVLAYASLNNLWKNNNRSSMTFSSGQGVMIRTCTRESIGSILGLDIEFPDRGVLWVLQVHSELISWIKSTTSPSHMVFNSLSSKYQTHIQGGLEITVPLLNLPCGESQCTARGYGRALSYSRQSVATLYSLWQAPNHLSLHGGSPKFHSSAHIINCCHGRAQLIASRQCPRKCIVRCCRFRTGYWSGW
jgi:hypothetical protein